MMKFQPFVFSTFGLLLTACASTARPTSTTSTATPIPTQTEDRDAEVDASTSMTVASDVAAPRTAPVPAFLPANPPMETVCVAGFGNPLTAAVLVHDKDASDEGGPERTQHSMRVLLARVGEAEHRESESSWVGPYDADPSQATEAVEAWRTAIESVDKLLQSAEKKRCVAVTATNSVYRTTLDGRDVRVTVDARHQVKLTVGRTTSTVRTLRMDQGDGGDHESLSGVYSLDGTTLLVLLISNADTGRQSTIPWVIDTAHPPAPARATR